MNTYSRMRQPTGNPTDSTLVKLKVVVPLSTYPILTSNTANDVTVQGNVIEGYNGGSYTPTILPPGFTQQFNQYNKYICYGCGVRVTWFNGTAADPAIVAVIPVDNDAVMPSDPQDALSMKYAKWKVLGPATGQGVKTIKHYMTSTKMAGIPWGKDIAQSAVTMNTTTVGGAPAFIPLQQWKWHIIYDNPNLISPSTPVKVSLLITWYCRFFDRKTLTQ